jgi:hypothetical protein
MPAPTPIPPEILALIARYQKTQKYLIDLIAKMEARGNVLSYRRAIMNYVNAELAALNKFAENWSNDYIPKVYASSVRKLYAFYKAAGLDMPEVALNRRAIDLIVENTVGLLEDANKHLGRIMNDTIRQAGVEATAEKLAAGDTVKQMKKNLEGKLLDQGLTSITYRNGKKVRIDAYAELVARSTTTETTNRATMQQMEDLDEDLVQMTNHNSSCPICATYEGRVYSITGKDKRYPKLDNAFKPPYANIHPQCRHRITPYIEKFDDNAAETRRYSNRSFKTDPRSQAEKDRYDKEQAKKAQLRQDRNTWEEMKLLLPDDAPKSLSAFRAMKRADNEKYRMLMHDYIYVKKTVEKTEKVADNIKLAKEIKMYTSFQLKNMSLKKLQSTATSLATEWYKSGKSGISFGDADVSKAAASLVKGSSKTSLIRDILALQKKLKK